MTTEDDRYRIRRLVDERDALRAENQQLQGDAGQLAIDLSVALSENERLRAVVQAAEAWDAELMASRKIDRLVALHETLARLSRNEPL